MTQPFDQPVSPPQPVEPDAEPDGPLQPPAPPESLLLAAPPPQVMNRGVSRGLVAVLAPVLAVVVFSAGVFFGRLGPVAEVPSPSPTHAAGADAELALIEEAWRAVLDNYVDAPNLDHTALAYGAIRGLADAVGDKGHTTFLTADDVKASEQSLSGTFVGIGVQVSENEAGDVVVSSVIPNTPAEEAGLHRNDRILAVDGTTTKGETLDQTVSRVRGPEGEPVTITIGRAGTADFDVKIIRRRFDLPLVSWAMVPGRTVALVRLDQFATGATEGITKAVDAAKAAGATAIILDLRGNPGGYVTEAVGVASQFVGDGLVYQATDASGKSKKIEVEKGGVATEIPLVVLTNGETASSAEIVTGAIQDAGRATVVGEKTFGTGTVLGRFDLADGSSLRIGVERWTTRDGRPIWHEGLDPDIIVKLADTASPVYPNDLQDMTAVELAAATDTQLLRALEVLAGKG